MLTSAEPFVLLSYTLRSLDFLALLSMNIKSKYYFPRNPCINTGV